MSLTIGNVPKVKILLSPLANHFPINIKTGCAKFQPNRTTTRRNLRALNLEHTEEYATIHSVQKRYTLSYHSHFVLSSYRNSFGVIRPTAAIETFWIKFSTSYLIRKISEITWNVSLILFFFFNNIWYPTFIRELIFNYIYTFYRIKTYMW